MQSKRKQNSIVTHERLESGAIRFTVGTQSFDFELPSEGSANYQQAALHGFVQKISDRAAIGRDPETGASATPEEKFAAMKECADRLMSGGPWNAVQTGGAGAQGGLLYRAMRALYPNAWSDKVSFAAYIAQKAISESARLGKRVSETDVRNGLMATKKIAKEIDRIRQEEGKALAIDAGGMLQELEGGK
jgi:hypothetical protein